MQPLSAFLARVVPPVTPALVMRRAQLAANLATLQRLCDAAGVQLRAHGKMHKCSTLGRLQVAHGAVGLCCQTLDEAEAFVSGGIADVLITAPLAPWALPRLRALVQRRAEVAVVVDDAAQVARLAEAGLSLSVLVDLDSGMHRTGCAPAEAVGLAQAIAAAPTLRFGGVQAYLGQVQHEADLAARARAVTAATGLLRGVVAELGTAGLPPPVVTGGGTGTYTHDLASGIFTELQAGSYAVMDVEYEDCGAPDGQPWPFGPALFVASTIVSAKHDSHAACDAGLKAVASDGPPPRIVAGAGPASRWRAMGDEHGAILAPATHEGRRLVSGDRVWLQPGHCDPTIHLYEALYAADEDGCLERWPIDARRRTP